MTQEDPAESISRVEWLYRPRSSDLTTADMYGVESI